jgi:hypothetical protein
MKVLEEVVNGSGTGDDEIGVVEITKTIVSLVDEKVLNFSLGDVFLLHYFVLKTNSNFVFIWPIIQLLFIIFIL